MAKFCSECGSAGVGGRFCSECGAVYAEPRLPRSHTLDVEPSRREAARLPASVSARVHTGSSASTDSAENPAYRRVHSEPPQPPHGVLKGRYADHPNCDVCNIGFDVTKRRHQWCVTAPLSSLCFPLLFTRECVPMLFNSRRCGLFVCSACSPLRLLVPWGHQIEDARGYDKSTPQRVCLRCAPELHSVQAELVQQYARANELNVHETKGRLHLPYTESLAKECQNAADIIGNFFRNEWGASSDLGVPVAFLQKA
ncbi:hypothetical protein BBJ28_00021611, partial [Nothophytophthora sp. Chile5]